MRVPRRDGGPTAEEVWMVERLRPRDVALLSRESPSTPMHVATLDIFETPATGFDYDALVALVHDRLAFVPRFRQRVQRIPGRLANPVWVDDAEFELGYHLRRSALPRPGSMQQLRDLTARIMSRRLDRSRPLWETYLIEGLSDNRYAVLTKSHLALVDGATIDLGQLIVHESPDARPTPDVAWTPEAPPSALDLVSEAVAESMVNPGMAADHLRGQLSLARQVTDRVRMVAADMTGRHVMPTGRLGAELSEQRRFTTVDTRLSAYRAVRKAHGGSINDVVLATIAGALRTWLLTRGENVSGGTRLRALVPMSVVDDEHAEPTSLGSQVTPRLFNLPVGESNPVMRLHQVSYAFKAHRETGRAVSAYRLVDLAGFAPTTFHALGARVAAGHQSSSYDLLITNVPGPQVPLYSAGATMLASYPVLPLAQGHALAVGATSYNGQICYGLDADRDAMPDLDVLSQCIVESLEELVEASSQTNRRAPRGRLNHKAEA